MTRSNTIGFVGGIELPPIKLAEDAWVAGARAVNPAITARSTYLNTFDDVAAGREAAIALLQAGVDMFHHNADQAALGVFQAVKESPRAFIFGSNLDQTALAPARVLGSAIIDLPRAFLAIAREAKAGAFQPKVESFGLKSGVIRYEANAALESTLPEALRERVTAARDSIIAADTSAASPS
jgi:basic membrane protein A